MLPAVAGPGFEVGDLYVLALAFLGIAVFAAIGALSNQDERAFSAAIIYLGLGLAAAVVIRTFDVPWLDPLEDAEIVQRLAELAVIVALFATGLKVDRRLSWREWGSVVRLLAVVMPLTIAAIALFGTAVMGLPLAAAIVLGAALAPTDPVLAGDVGVGPPGEEDEREPHFAITSEAGLNDGLAFPFVNLGLFLAVADRGDGWFLEWLAADVLYAIAVGIGFGAAGGYLLAAAVLRLRDRKLLARDLDGWVAVGAVLLLYGLTELAGGYGFLAAFAGGLAFRRYERDHVLNERVHEGAEVVEKFGELAAILLLGSMVTVAGWAEAGWAGAALAPLLLLVIRPLAVLAAFVGSGLGLRERAFLGWFGVRGIGSLYYVAAALASGLLAPDDAEAVFWAIAACVVASILAHGITGSPFARRLVRRRGVA
ncbi:MAG TPA: cation:proton antiporter [Gaiellaceae bacterium]|nr:cation:proton antiporter [Gaiellaceae bacterium]